MTIRRATGEDFPAMLDITVCALRELASSRYPVEALNEAIESGRWTLHRELLETGNYFVAEEDGILRGGVGWNTAGLGEAAIPLTTLPRTASLRAMFVDPRAAGRGIGTRLLRYCIADMEAAGFEHIELFASFNAEALYARHGFVALAEQHLELPSGTIMTGRRMRRACQPS